MADAREVGERISYHRKRLGLSQVEFAGMIGKSESWVSQVERGVRGIDRLSVLQTVADALEVSVAELRGEAETEPITEEHPQAFEALRLTLTGHPTPSAILAPSSIDDTDVPSLDSLRSDHAAVWPMVHGSLYGELAPLLSRLITGLELSTRRAATEVDADEARRLLADTYQATSAALAKLGDADAAWIAADRAAFVSEALGSPLAVAASLFRMAHVFISLGHLLQAHKVAASAEVALESRIGTDAETETLSLYGAFQLVLAIAAARENERAEAHKHLDTARGIAARVGEGRNDFGTEFGPTNVALHAVSVAVELGDAGQALELSRDVDVTNLSPERQARYLIDLAAAHAMRRQIGEALRCLQEAEELTPEQTRTHRVARNVARVLLQLSGVRVRPELREMAERFGIT
jgi:transcriptional regulator with XRE-family HTH domain